MRKSVLMILFLLCFAVGKSQSATFIHPFTIQVQDSTMKEIGYFKYDTVKNTVVTRGALKYSFQYFVEQIFIPFWELSAAQEQMMQYVLPDGTIIDKPGFGYAVQRYYAVRKKYGM